MNIILTCFTCLLISFPYLTAKGEDYEVLSATPEVDGIQRAISLTHTEVKTRCFWCPAEPNPPLSVREAVRIAQLAIGSFRRKGIVHELTRWSFEKASLYRIYEDSWYYQVTFISANTPATTTICVLMDGSWIVPEIDGKPSYIMKVREPKASNDNLKKNE